MRNVKTCIENTNRKIRSGMNLEAVEKSCSLYYAPGSNLTARPAKRSSLARPRSGGHVGGGGAVDG